VSGSNQKSTFDDPDLRAVWRERAQKYGARSVINLSYPPEHFEMITKQQKQFLLPRLQAGVSGWERTVLDFGCGPGRFTPDLANLMPGGGSAVGFDISQELLDLAPRSPNVRYTSSPDELASSALKERFDVLWICLVLGGIPDPRCGAIMRQLLTTLTPGGLIFFVEHISSTKPGSSFWKFRSLADYQAMFAPVPLTKIGAYLDMDEEVSILIGRTPTV
jgi:2-polyprenyl-3-methyl-5-hydroxy-6-metoxy-1,4-benzoquinol methylase